MRRHLMVLAIGVWATGVSSTASLAQEFTLQVGLPIAGNAQPAKSSLLVVRSGGCADPAAARITATAEGVVDGTRQSVPIALNPLPTPGVHAVPKDWVRPGVWVVSLVGTCGGRTAAAIVPLTANGAFQREKIRQLAHPPTTSEIEASLRSLTSGGQR